MVENIFINDVKYYQLTDPDNRVARKVANHINKNFPACAIVKDDCCFIKGGYWEACQQYVLTHCKIKEEAK